MSRNIYVYRWFNLSFSPGLLALNLTTAYPPGGITIVSFFSGVLLKLAATESFFPSAQDILLQELSRCLPSIGAQSKSSLM